MKVAVSVPDPIFEAAERMAQERRIPRSQLFAQALEEYIARHASEAVTAQLNEVYARTESGMEAPLLRAQLANLKHEAW
jgi:metal-responsive CopG/Arc/MetJ family transcriptional regulator